MKTVVLASLDDIFCQRVAATLVRDARIVLFDRMAPLFEETLAAAVLIIVDCRDDEGEAIRLELARRRLADLPLGRCVLVTPLAPARVGRVAAAPLANALDVVFPNVESIGHVIRAHLNDPTRSDSGAAVLQILLRLLPREAHDTLDLVLGTGFQVSLVKQLAAYEEHDPKTVGTALRARTALRLKDVIAIAKASYAAMLLRRTDLTPGEIAKAIQFNKAKSLDDLLRRMFEMNASDVRDSGRGIPATAWLERRVRSWLARTAR